MNKLTLCWHRENKNWKYLKIMDSTLSRNLQPRMGVAVDGAYSKHHTVNPPDDKEPVSFIFIFLN